MKYFTIFLGIAIAGSAIAANEWEPVDLPDYAASAEFVAIGSDGFLYEVQSNENGLVLTSLSEHYGFQPRDQWTVDILAAKPVYYLGKTCDASGGGSQGIWTKDETGLNVALMAAPNAPPTITWRLLDTDLTSGNNC